MIRAYLTLLSFAWMLHACGPKANQTMVANPDELRGKYDRNLELDEAQLLQQAEKTKAEADQESALCEEEFANSQALLEKADAEKTKDKKQWYTQRANAALDKGYKQQISTSEKYAKANSDAIVAYRKASTRLASRAPEYVQKVGEKTSHDADQTYQQAKQLRQQAQSEKDPKKKAQLLSRANELEFLAVDEHHRVFDLYTGKLKIEAPIEVVEQNQPEQKDPTEILDPVEETIVQPASAASIVYKIQIAASEVELPMDKLEAIYSPKPGEMINNNIEDGWYKYAIGKFSTYAEAQAYKDEIRVPGSFIIAYQENQKIVLPEIQAKIARGELSEVPKNKPQALQTDVIYMVQIAATQIPARPAQLQEMYHGKQIVSIRQARGWYKYTVGNFDTRQKAEQFQKEIGVQGAFVVAFDKQGMEVSLDK